MCRGVMAASETGTSANGPPGNARSGTGANGTGGSGREPSRTASVQQKPADRLQLSVSGQTKPAVLPDSNAVPLPTALQLSPVIAQLAVELDVAIPVPEFRLRNLVNLETGQVVETRWLQDQDLPLAAGEVQLGWSQFDVTDNKLAVRLTRLA